MPFVGTALDSTDPDGIEAQTRQVLKNLQTVLAGCGLGREHAVSARVYLTHFDEDDMAMNAVYMSVFTVSDNAYFGPALAKRKPIGSLAP